MATSCRYEFKWKNFGFFDCEPVRFYRSQWGSNKIAYVLYRLFMFAYCLSWIIADVVVIDQPDYATFLTNWMEVTVCLYFLLAAMIAIYGLAKNDNDELRWFHIIVWLMFVVAFSISLATCLVFWGLLAGLRSLQSLANPFNIQSHALTFVVMVIDLFVNAIPVRLLHFIYPMTYGLTYMLFTLILHWSGVTSAVYSVLNWATDPGLAALYALATALVLCPVCHVLSFGLYHFRAWIARRHNFEPLEGTERSTGMEMGNTNPAFA